MKNKDKQTRELEKENDRLYETRIYWITTTILFFMVFILIAIIILPENSKLESDLQECQEDYEWLKGGSIDCWNRLRKLDTHCWSATDCIENPELEGCERWNCNWACCDERGICESTLVGCWYLTKEEVNEIYRIRCWDNDLPNLRGIFEIINISEEEISAIEALLNIMYDNCEVIE